MPDRDAFIISAVRTAIGGLRDCPPEELAAAVLKQAAGRAEVGPQRVEDVLWAGDDENDDLKFQSIRMAGFPHDLPVMGVKRGRLSGLQAIISGAQAVLSADADIVICCGSGLTNPSLRVDTELEAPALYSNELRKIAGSLADRSDFSREQMDGYAFQSYTRANNALHTGRFDGQIAALTLPDGSQLGPSASVKPVLSLQELAALPPRFVGDERITAGNSAQLVNGAAALLLTSAQAVGKLNLMPMARIGAQVVVGGEPGLTGSSHAARKALQRAGLSLDEMDVIETDEDSAVLVLDWAREMDADLQRINPNGGAIAHGYIPGAMGAIQMTALVHELERRKGRYGLLCMRGDHGMAGAMIIERV